MNVFELFGQMSIKGLDKTKGQLTGLEKNVQRVQKGMKIMGAAFTAVGVAGLAMIQSTKKINADLAVTALNLGVTTKEMRDLTLATTNVTFPIKEVTATFDLLARAGVKDTEVLKATAIAFDTLGDATGRSASQVTQMMIPAMKTFGLTATEMAAKTDIMTFMARKSTMTMEDFNTMVGYTTPELVKAGLTMEELTAILIHMETQGYAPGRVMTREFMKATTLATKEQIPLYEAIGMTSEELKGLQEELDGATGMTQKYADVANEQYTIMDKLKTEWEKLTLAASEYLEPLEPILAGMTALGPLMIGLSMVGIPKLIIAVKALGHALKTLLLNPITGIIAGLVMMGIGIYALIKHHTDWNKIVEGATRVNEALEDAQGELTEEVIDASRAYVGLREAYGQLTPEEEAHIERLKEMLRLYDEGKIAIGTRIIQINTQALETLRLMSATRELGGFTREYAESLIEAFRATDTLSDSTKELRKETNKLAKAQERSLAAFKETLSVIGQLFPGGFTEEAWAQWQEAGLLTPQAITGFQAGGIITKPTLALLGEQAPGIKEFVFNERQLGSMIHGLQSQRPYAIAGIEHVGPGVGGGITINIIEPHVRNDRDIDLMGEQIVARLRQMGVKL